MKAEERAALRAWAETLSWISPVHVLELLDALEAAETRLAGFHAQAMGIMETVKASDDSALLWELVHDLCMVEAP